MGSATGGSPPGGEVPNRRGWRPPDDATSAGNVGRPENWDVERYDRQPQPPPQERAPALPTTMPDSVTGLVRAVNTTSVPGQNGVQTTIVTFRLEQYDPRAGRTGVMTVRLFGDEAIGFVTDGDWVEVTGKSKRGFLKADQAVNHTSHAQYSRRGQGCARAAFAVVFILAVLFVLAIFVSLLVSVVHR